MNRPRKGGYHFLPMGTYNNSIPFEFFQAMDSYQKPRWRRIDIQKTFNLEPEPIEIPNNEFVRIGIQANTEIDVRKLEKGKLYLSSDGDKID